MYTVVLGEGLIAHRSLRYTINLIFTAFFDFDSEDKSQHSQLAVHLLNTLSFPCAVAIPNYRLSPSRTALQQPLHHPAHAEDILLALNYLHSQEGNSIYPEIAGAYDPRSIHLVSHSCSAHILGSIFLDSSHITPSLTPSSSLLSSVRSITCSEGIYDLDLLIKSFPGYLEWFILAAFGEHKTYEPYSVTAYNLRENSSHIRWLIVQSPGDKLIDTAQAAAFRDHLLKLQQQHSGIYFEYDDTTLTGDHHEIPRSEEFYQMIVRFVQGCK